MSISQLPASSGVHGHKAQFSPLKILDIELAEPLPHLVSNVPIGRKTSDRALALIRLHGHPIGAIYLDLADGLTPQQVAEKIWTQLRNEVTGHLAQDAIEPPMHLDPKGLVPANRPACSVSEKDLPPVSVVVATKDRPESLVRSIKSLMSLDYPAYEVIVVDNSAFHSKVDGLISQTFGERANLRVVSENVPGVSNARNRGALEASADIIAFIDDDVVVDKGWLKGIIRGFRSAPHVSCVTSLVMPAELETPAQVWFEQYGGFSKGYERNVFDLNSGSGQNRLYPYTAGQFGAGAAMAFKAEVLRHLGGFDTNLGPGTLSRGGEDIDLFLRLLLSGRRLVYEPSALAWHYHREHYNQLRSHLRNYGVGLGAVMTKLLFQPATRLDVLKRIPFGIALLFSPRSPKNAGKASDFPRPLFRAELVGMAYGPPAYILSRLNQRSRTNKVPVD